MPRHAMRDLSTFFMARASERNPNQRKRGSWNFIVPLICVVALAPFANAEDASESDDAIQFNRDIRPILSENCFHCHGPDDENREAGLHLDTEEGAKDWAIVEGDWEASEVWLRMVSDDPDMLMPPPDSERKVTPEQTELVRRWIEQGAHYQSHWSFISPTDVDVPNGVVISDQSPGATNEIDRFINRALTEAGLQPEGEADKETWLRRVTFDLIGIPPTLSEMDAFLADDSSMDKVRVIDRLLARPEYGERMATDWLDAARYSDTYGYQVDRDRFVWPWRDWVTNAFNDNMPYDEFVTQQLAGDLLPDANREQILATTFNRLHPQKVEGGSVPEEFRIEYVADRAQTVATAMMGLTYECCRCHNHKYDPISQENYFQLNAFFDNIDEAGLYSYFTPSVPTPTLSLPTEEEERQLKQLQSDIVVAEQRLRETIRERREHWSEQLSQSGLSSIETLPEHRLAEPIASLDFEDEPKSPNQSVEGKVGKAWQLTGDDAVATEVGNFDRSQPFSVSLWMKTPDLKERAVVWHRSRAWTDAASRGYELLILDGKLQWSQIHFWPGNAISVVTDEVIPVGEWVHVTATTEGSSSASGLKIYVDGKAIETSVVRDALTKQIQGGGGDNITIGERMRDRGFKKGAVDQFRVFDVCLSDLEIQQLARGEYEFDTESGWDQDQVIDHALERWDEEVASARTKLREARVAKCKLEDSLDEIMVMRELPEQRPTHLLARGVYDSPQQVVQPGTPDFLPPMKSDDSSSPNRLTLAKWLCDREHPLTSRVAVNRLWQICFGQGLVRTPEDFGSQGMPPTHPELLDWLALDLADNDWDLKRMMKQIMLSDAYGRSSVSTQDKLALVDPTNRLLSHFPTYRLPAEMLRDQALAAGGRLVRTMGGPPAKPYEVEVSFKPTDRDKGEGLYRRSLYTYWKRTSPAPVMTTLDAAKRDVCRVQRERTASPLQAFVMLNGPQTIEASRGLAEKLIREATSSDVKTVLRDAFRVTTSRRPTQDQLSVLIDLYEEQLNYFQTHETATSEFLSIGDSDPDALLDANRVATMTVVVGTLLNFDLCLVKR
ncbi:protein containing planctomycete cytochrome C domain protein [Rhodopirellula baltica SH28]|uniref:Protein containing planctomycete cytochrome C domain protein n=2 Tax=Rhodopirellula baltica TaxID=265606 RepID=K5DHH2_RHOBT|nr:protein containing planctomycete cytochrome C domain protein [Rhodopirellula baltica SH28]